MLLHGLFVFLNLFLICLLEGESVWIQCISALFDHATFLFRARWTPSLRTAHHLRQRPPTARAMLPTRRAAMPPELPPKSPTRGTLTHNLLSTASPSQTWANEMVSNIQNDLAALDLISRLWGSLKVETFKCNKHCSSFYFTSIWNPFLCASFRQLNLNLPFTHVFCPTIQFTNVFLQ